jgi:hypothetical protein
MVRFAASLVVVLALQALAIACGTAPHQPGPPATVPAPAATPPASPSLPPLPGPTAPVDPKSTPRDSGGVTYPWQSGPIAAL